MSSPVKSLAASAARTVGRRLRARRASSARARVRGHVAAPPAAEPEPRTIPLPQADRLRLAEQPSAAEGEPRVTEGEPRADAAELDSLRGALVHELDRLAGDDDCSASFRRAG
jgi:hypothetical protein